jgi:hypothetical protein
MLGGVNNPDPSAEVYLERLRAAVAAGDERAGFLLPAIEEMVITERAAAALVDQILARQSGG